MTASVVFEYSTSNIFTNIIRKITSIWILSLYWYIRTRLCHSGNAKISRSLFINFIILELFRHLSKCPTPPSVFIWRSLLPRENIKLLIRNRIFANLYPKHILILHYLNHFYSAKIWLTFSMSFWCFIRVYFVLLLWFWNSLRIKHVPELNVESLGNSFLLVRPKIIDLSQRALTHTRNHMVPDDFVVLQSGAGAYWFITRTSLYSRLILWH